MERAGFMTYTASSHLGAIEALWLHFSGLVWHAWLGPFILHLFIYYLFIYFYIYIYLVFFLQSMVRTK